jgi:hypothetical protein
MPDVTGHNNGDVLSIAAGAATWQPPAQVLPDVTGHTGDVLAVDAAGTGLEWRNPPHDIPVGGTTGQVLAKASATNRDVHWVDPGRTVTATATPNEEPVAGNGNDGDLFVNVTDGKLWAKAGGSWVLVYDKDAQFDPGTLFTGGRAIYDPTHTYNAGEVVEHNMGFWLATGAVAANVEPGTNQLWTRLALDTLAGAATGLDVNTILPSPRDPYDATRPYVAGEVVEHQGMYWVATVAVGSGVDPGASPLWKRLVLYPSSAGAADGDVLTMTSGVPTWAAPAAGGGTMNVEVITRAAYTALGAAIDPTKLYLVTP